MIGIFDSGVGGLTVVKEIFKRLPQYQITYFGDTARLPYGTKGANFINRYSEKITKLLLNQGSNIIVVACNTASAWAADNLKNKFRNVPIFEMITPAVREAVQKTRNKKIGIIGTPGTIKSGVYKRKLMEFNGDLKLFSKACPLFVPLVEEGLVSGKITKDIAKNYLLPLKRMGIDVLILACTHYPLLEDVIKEIMGRNVEIINPAKSLVGELKLYIDDNQELKLSIKRGVDHKFQFSDEPYNFKKISHLCFSKKLKIKIKDPFE